MFPREFARPLLVGTSNTGKFAEIATCAARFGFTVIPLTDPSLIHAGSAPRVAEVATTYQENAQAKGRAYAAWSGRPCLTDDTGLEIPMLNDLPGVYTAPWGPRRVQDALGMYRVVPARFVCCMVYTEPLGRSVSTTGVVEGELRNLVVSDQRNALPFSRFFFPHGSHEPLSILISRGYEGSHRSRALKTLVEVLG
jgi:XTP/dITP diphosphohydrolase